MKLILFFCFIFFLTFTSCNCEKCKTSGTHENNQAQTEGWKFLFNQYDLSGWEIVGSNKAKFFVEDGTIVGETQKGIPNCFLITKKEYEDFILELEFIVDSTINTGVHIRSGIYQKETSTIYLSGKLEELEKTWEKGRVYGYQIEIDPSDRAWTGGFYEEGGRGWLQPLINNESARKAYNRRGWNHFKIVANDNHFQTWINGVKAADIYDNMKRSGFIGFQLHSVHRDDMIGKRIIFKNIKLKELP